MNLVVEAKLKIIYRVQKKNSLIVSNYVFNNVYYTWCTFTSQIFKHTKEDIKIITLIEFHFIVMVNLIIWYLALLLLIITSMHRQYENLLTF